MRIQRMIVTVLGAGILFWSGAAYGQSGTCTPITSVPTTITTSGVYCLTGNLAYPYATGAAITIDVNGVVLDFNGYRLLSTAAPAPIVGIDNTGVEALDEKKNITIRNGLISGFGRGIFSYARATIVEDMRLSETSQSTFGLPPGLNPPAVSIHGSSSIIRRNHCRMNALCIYVSGNSTSVVDNDIVGQTGQSNGGGIRIIGLDALVVGNRLSRLDSGISFAPVLIGSGGTGKYRGNLTSNVTFPFDGGTDAGNNN